MLTLPLFHSDESPLLAPLFTTKREVLLYLEKKAASGAITHNNIRTGPWLDIGELSPRDSLSPFASGLITIVPQFIHLPIRLDSNESCHWI